jgi:DNA-binding transcriptional LysR family regulator
VPNSFVSDSFDVEVLFDDPHFVVAGKGSRWAQGSNISLAELKNEPWTIPPSPIINTLLQEMFETEGLAWISHTIFPQLSSSAREFISVGLGMRDCGVGRRGAGGLLRSCGEQRRDSLGGPWDGAAISRVAATRVTLASRGRRLRH